MVSICGTRAWPARATRIADVYNLFGCGERAVERVVMEIALSRVGEAPVVDVGRQRPFQLVVRQHQHLQFAHVCEGLWQRAGHAIVVDAGSA